MYSDAPIVMATDDLRSHKQLDPGSDVPYSTQREHEPANEHSILSVRSTLKPHGMLCRSVLIVQSR